MIDYCFDDQCMEWFHWNRRNPLCTEATVKIASFILTNSWLVNEHLLGYPIRDSNIGIQFHCRLPWSLCNFFACCICSMLLSIECSLLIIHLTLEKFANTAVFHPLSLVQLAPEKKFSDCSTSSSDWHWLFAFANRKLQIVAPRESWPIIGQYFLDEKVLLPGVSQKLMNMILDSRFEWIAFKLNFIRTSNCKAVMPCQVYKGVQSDVFCQFPLLLLDLHTRIRHR